jgi:hypothetical protein
MKYYKIMFIPILCFSFSTSNAEESNSVKIKREKINGVVSKYFKKIASFEEEKEPEKDTENLLFKVTDIKLHVLFVLL